MSFYPLFPASLADAEFALLRFGLALTSPCVLGLGELLTLRPSLIAAAGALPAARRDALFTPALSSDPTARRRYQRPAPPFVLQSVSALTGDHHEGDRIELEVLFLGTGTMAIGDFLEVLQSLGESGLTRGAGRYKVDRIRSRGADGKWRDLQRGPRSHAELAFDLLRLDQWLDRSWPEMGPLILELTTPVRLHADGRVLRRPRFRQIFPFLLRRASSMLYAHCHLEPVADLSPLLEAAGMVESEWVEHDWFDWRDRPGSDGLNAIGGCVGQLRLHGAGLEAILWVVLLATVFGVGKGAAYGAGSCRLYRPGSSSLSG